MQQSVQRAPYNVAQELSKRFQAALTKLKFSKEISFKWFTHAKKALASASPISLGCTAKEMKDVFETEPGDLTMLQFAMLSNNIEGKSMNDLQLNPDDYFAVMAETQELSQYWNDHTKELRSKIEKDLVNEMATKDQIEKRANNLAKA